MGPTLKRTFAALEVRNFRLFIFGQGISMVGTWTQTIGLSWLVLKLTHSGTQLGLVVATQFLPILLLGVWGGVIADRFTKRRVLYITQTLAGLLALTLGLLVVTHVIQLWMIYLLAVSLGLVNVADNPTRQSFVMEMVGTEHLKNAVTLNSTLVNTARVIGPTIAGTLIATIGIGPCFLVNAASYVAVLIALILMRSGELQPAPHSAAGSGQIRAGLAYAWGVPRIRSTLIMMFIIGTFAYEFPVILPLFATITLHGSAGTYAALMGATGLGAIFGGLYTAGRAEVRETQLATTAILFGISILLAAVMPTFILALLVLVLVGVLSVLFIALGNTTLQLTSEPTMRGRVMALWAIAFLGTTPIGGPIVGFISDHSNPRVGLATGGLSAVIAGAFGLWAYKKTDAA
jgi:MFS family permease